MKQINLYVDEKSFKALKYFAKEVDMPTSTLAKQITIPEIKKFLVDKSIEEYKSGRIGFKRAWKLSRISFFEFVNELIKQDIEPPLSEKVQDYGEEVRKKVRDDEVFL